ncbi:MAG TPA: disulfide bond formation protein B [Candidatus Paceibacterota bacterium]|nr:disulfide bond formation protein B [Candidatus Paceibacterota bacterium]
MSLLFTLNFVLAVGGLAMLVLTIGLFVDYIFYQRQFYLQYVSPVAWPLILLVTIGSVLLSLLYSEYFGFVPCSLCWLQRIALYPQALFALMAFKTRENIFYPMYSIGLSVFGLIVAVYHYIYQLIPAEVREGGLMPCLADGSSDCASVIMNQFGFVTFPFLSAVTFAFLIILYLNIKKG